MSKKNRLSFKIQALTAVFTLASSFVFSASANQPAENGKSYRYHSSRKRTYDDKWPMYLELEGKKGNFRDIARLSWLVPIWQDDESMLFGDVRVMMDNRSDREANISLGYRQIFSDWDVMSDGVILGAYISYDRRKSTLGNKYNQAAFGVEALGECFRFSANYYAPQNKKHHIGRTLSPSIIQSGWNFVDSNLVFTYSTLLNAATNTELTLKGYDVELRGKYPITEVFNLWGGIGAYRFSRSGVHRNGPMAMVDVEFIDGLGIEGSRASLGFEYRKDKGERANRYGVIKLTAPLASIGKGQSYPNLTGVEYEMTRFILRDVDIQTGIESKREIQPRLTSGGILSGLSRVHDNSDESAQSIHIYPTGNTNLYGGLVRAAHESSDLATVMLDQAKSDPSLENYVFMIILGADAENTPITITKESMNNAYIGIEESTDIEASRKAQFEGLKSENDTFPILPNTIVLGAQSHGLSAASLLSEEHIINALADADDDLATYKQVYIDHISAPENSQGLFGGEYDVSEVNFDGSVQFAREATVSSGIAIPGNVSAKAINTASGVKPAFQDLSVGNIQNSTYDIRAVYENTIDGSNPRGSFVNLTDANALLNYGSKMVIVSSDVNASNIDNSKLRMINFSTNVNSDSFSGATVSPTMKAIDSGLASVPVCEFTANGSSSPFSIISQDQALPVAWSFASATAFETFAPISGIADVFIVAGMPGVSRDDSLSSITTKYSSQDLTKLETSLPANVSANSAAVGVEFAKGLKSLNGDNLTIDSLKDALQSQAAALSEVESGGSISLVDLANDSSGYAVQGLYDVVTSSTLDEAINKLSHSLNGHELHHLTHQTVMTATLASFGNNAVAERLVALPSDDQTKINDAASVLLDDPNTEEAVSDLLTVFTEYSDASSTSYQGVMQSVADYLSDGSGNKELFNRLGSGEGLPGDQRAAAQVIQDAIALGVSPSTLIVKNPSATASTFQAVVNTNSLSDENAAKQNGALQAIFSSKLQGSDEHKKVNKMIKAVLPYHKKE